MFGRVMDAVWMLKGYMAVSAGLGLVLGIIYRISLSRFGWNGILIRIHGFFTDLSQTEQIRVSCLYLRLVMMAYAVVTMTVSRPVYPAMLISFAVILGLLSFRIRGILEEAGNTLLMLGGLYASGVLLAYMREIRFENSIFAVYVLAGLFMVLYTAYFFLRDIKKISEGRTRRNGNPEIRKEE